MKKTYATSMPNHIGAFLKASKCFTALGVGNWKIFGAHGAPKDYSVK